MSVTMGVSGTQLKHIQLDIHRNRSHYNLSPDNMEELQGDLKLMQTGLTLIWTEAEGSRCV